MVPKKKKINKLGKKKAVIHILQTGLSRDVFPLAIFFISRSGVLDKNCDNYF